MGDDICSALGHDARGMTGGRTERRRSGSVPVTLGRGVLICGEGSLMIISG
jgi:hypothetical protein